jgi:hypothetical protein
MPEPGCNSDLTGRSMAETGFSIDASVRIALIDR